MPEQLAGSPDACWIVGFTIRLEPGEHQFEDSRMNGLCEPNAAGETIEPADGPLQSFTRREPTRRFVNEFFFGLTNENV